MSNMSPSFTSPVFLGLCAIGLLVGCAAEYYKPISFSQFVNYGDTPLSHTVYVGSDTENHYFVWTYGKTSGKWQVEKSQMPFHAEADFGQTQTFLVKDDEGLWQPYGI